MTNWKQISQSYREPYYEYINSVLKFNCRNKPAFIIEGNYKQYDLSLMIGCNPEIVFSDLELCSIRAFRSLTGTSKKIIALEHYHPGYIFDPRLPCEKDEFDEWPIPIFPDGDYDFFFVEDNFNNCYIGDGIAHVIYIIGDAMINAFEENKPIIFDIIESKQK